MKGYRLEINIMINSSMSQRTTRKRKQPDTQSERTTLHEAVNKAALEKLAGFRAAGAWRPGGSGPTLRKIISDVLAQVRDNVLVSVWREEDRMKSLGLNGQNVIAGTGRIHTTLQTIHC